MSRSQLREIRLRAGGAPQHREKCECLVLNGSTVRDIVFLFRRANLDAVSSGDARALQPTRMMKLPRCRRLMPYFPAKTQMRLAVSRCMITLQVFSLIPRRAIAARDDEYAES